MAIEDGRGLLLLSHHHVVDARSSIVVDIFEKFKISNITPDTTFVINIDSADADVIDKGLSLNERGLEVDASVFKVISELDQDAEVFAGTATGKALSLLSASLTTKFSQPYNHLDLELF